MKRILRYSVALVAVCLICCGCNDNTIEVPDVIIGTTSSVAATQKTEVTTDTDITSESSENTELPAESTDAPVVLSREEEILAGMTLSEKVGQMIIGRCPDRAAAEDAAKYQLGGYIMFARDFEDGTPDSVRDDIASWQAASKIPMLIGVDEEGGYIVRVSKYEQYRSERFGSPMELYNEGGIAAVVEDAAEKCVLLSSLGINMNFAPVCDLPRSESDYIYDRTFGTDVDITADCIGAIVGKMNECGTISVLKHFPGYGNNVDTHTGIAYDERPLTEFREYDLLPFAAGIDADAPCVMVSHNIIMCVDQTMPASLSYEVHRLLREEFGFDGVIVTDELSMGAIEEFTDGENAAVQAVLAGNDLLCVTDYASSIAAITAAVESGEISEQRIDESVLRLLRMKTAFGILS